MQEIKFSLTLDEVNLVLEGLGTIPFAKVYALVGKVQEQAARQIQAANAAQTAAPGAADAPAPSDQEAR